jgi:hypothetical protein
MLAYAKNRAIRCRQYRLFLQGNIERPVGRVVDCAIRRADVPVLFVARGYDATTMRN